MSIYQVVVGNVGTVYDGDSYNDAMHAYGDYRQQSMDGIGRAAGESVTLFNDGEIEKEYEGRDWD